MAEYTGDPGGHIARTYGRAAAIGADQADTYPPAAPHLLIRASAGTGKTYQLTTRYLRLLLAGETAEHILATTFTRKAAGEVLGRVLGWLAEASVDAGVRADLDHALGGFGLDEQACLSMLRRLVDGLHRLSIGTIDSFFNRAARALRFELDLPAEPRVTDEQSPVARELRRDAIQRVLGDAAATDDGFQVLIELLRRVHHDSAGRSVTDTIDGLAVGLHEVYRQYPDAERWAKIDAPAPLRAEQLPALIEQVVALGEEIPLTQAGKPRQAFVKAWGELSAAVQSRDFESVLSHALCQQLLAGTPTPTYAKCEVPGAWRDALMPVIHHARALTAQQLAQMTESTYRLLDAFAGHYAQAKRRAGVLLFSDLTHLLAQQLPAMGDDAATQFYYRLDSRVTHLLLDEFQDTSLSQWQVLRPFAEEVTASADGERSFFCVGDEKQAIYGWRGGCAELFGAVEQLPGVSPWTMTQSRRSSQAVLDAVNQVFSSLGTNAALADTKYGGRWEGVVAQWVERFEAHSAHHRAMPGHVLLQTTAPRAVDDDGTVDDDDDAGYVGSASPHAVYCAEHIAALSAAGGPGRSVGVLVRRKRAAQGILLALRTMGVAVSEEGGNPIDHTPAVSAVLAAFRLADYPGDTVSAFHVANSPLGAVVGLDAVTPEAAAACATRLRRRLLDRGVGEVVAGWCMALAPACDARSLRRLEQLVSLAQAYDLELAATPGGGAGLRPAGFEAYARRARVASPTPAAVRVMTLHAAKGLEFDSVVLPDLDARLSQMDHTQMVMLDRDSPLDDPRAILRRIDRKKLASIGLEKIADREDALQRGEDLCLLYVGMTRAKHGLHLLVEPLKQTSKGLSSVGRTNLSYAAILRQALAPDSDEDGAGDALLYEHGDAGWMGEPMGSEATQADTATRGPIVLAKATRPTRGLPERRPSDGTDDTVVQAADLLGLTPSAGRGYGSAMHAVCERLGFVDEDPLPGTEAIADALAGVGHHAGPEVVQGFMARLARMLEADAVVAALSRGGAAELWREQPFAVAVAGRLVRGVFDRVHVWRDAESRAVRVRLIDFKTDRLTEAGPDALAGHYRGQMETYRAALVAMLGVEPAEVEAMLVLTGDAVVVRVA